MEIDLDNLVFSGLDEAEERNPERLEEAEKKRRRSLPMTIAATPAKSDCQTGQQAGFFCPSRLLRPARSLSAYPAAPAPPSTAAYARHGSRRRTSQSADR